VIESLSKRIDYEEILTGFAKKLEIEDSLKDIFSKIQIPNNPDDAAKALKLFNEPDIQKQFGWIQKIGMEGVDKKPPIKFDYMHEDIIAGYEPIENAIYLNLHHLNNPQLIEKTLLHEFGHARGMLRGDSIPSVGVVSDLLEVHNDIYVEKLLLERVSKEAADSYRTKIIDGLQSNKGNYDMLLYNNIQQIKMSGWDEDHYNKYWNSFIEQYQKAVYYGQNDIVEEIDDIFSLYTGEDYVKELKEYTELFQKTVKKDAKDITNSELIDLKKEYADTINRPYMASFLDTYDIASKKLSKELDDALKQLSNGLFDTLTKKEAKLLKQGLANLNEKLAKEIITNLDSIKPEGLKPLLEFFDGADTRYFSEILKDLFSDNSEKKIQPLITKYGERMIKEKNTNIPWGVLDGSYVFRGYNFRYGFFDSYPHLSATFDKDEIMNNPDRLREFIFERGFRARGKNLDIENHILGRDDSAYIGTSKSVTAAKNDFAASGNREGYVYFIKPSDLVAKDVRDDLVQYNLKQYADEFEIAIVDAIPPEQIIGARKVNEAGEFIGEFIKNPYFFP
jgi:hypothetical protein